MPQGATGAPCQAEKPNLQAWPQTSRSRRNWVWHFIALAGIYPRSGLGRIAWGGARHERHPRSPGNPYHQARVAGGGAACKYPAATRYAGWLSMLPLIPGASLVPRFAPGFRPPPATRAKSRSGGAARRRPAATAAANFSLSDDGRFPKWVANREKRQTHFRIITPKPRRDQELWAYTVRGGSGIRYSTHANAPRAQGTCGSIHGHPNSVWPEKFSPNSLATPRRVIMSRANEDPLLQPPVNR